MLNILHYNQHVVYENDLLIMLDISRFHPEMHFDYCII